MPTAKMTLIHCRAVLMIFFVHSVWAPFPLRNLKAEYAAACDDNYEVDRLSVLFVQDATRESAGMVLYAGREAMWRAGLDEEEYVRVDGRRMYESKKSDPIFHTTFRRAGAGSDSFDIRPSRRRCNHRRRPWSRLPPADRNLVTPSLLTQREGCG